MAIKSKTSKIAPKQKLSSAGENEKKALKSEKVRIQTAEGWKRSQLKLRNIEKPSAKLKTKR